MQTDRFAQFGIFGGGVFFTVVGLANPFFTLYAAELGASTFTIGMLVTLRAVLPIVIAMPAGQLIDTVGPMRMLSIGSVCLVASLLCTVMAQGIPLLAVSQILLGAAIIISASSLQVLVAKGARDKRNDAIKRYSMWMSGGGMLGPLIGGFIATLSEAPQDGYRAAFIVSSMAMTVFLAAVLLLARRYTHSQAEGGPSVREVLSARGVLDSYKRGIDLTAHRPVQFGLTGTFLIMYIQALYMSFLPLFLDQNGYATLMISTIISLKGLAGMLSRYLLGVLMKRFSLESILTTAGVIAATCVVLTPLVVGSVPAMVVVALVLGGAVGVNLPVSIMIMVDAIGESERGKLMGLRLLVNRFSQILSPVMFGILGQAFGLSAAFLSGGGLLVATVLGFAVHSRASMPARPLGATPVDQSEPANEPPAARPDTPS